MPVKFTKVDPTPVPLPPATYSITGLSYQQVLWLRDTIRARRRSLGEHSFYPHTQDEIDFFRRLDAVILVGE